MDMWSHSRQTALLRKPLLTSSPWREAEPQINGCAHNLGCTFSLMIVLGLRHRQLILRDVRKSSGSENQVSGFPTKIHCPLCQPGQAEHSWVVGSHSIGILYWPHLAKLSQVSEPEPTPPQHTSAAISGRCFMTCCRDIKLAETALHCPKPRATGKNGKCLKFKLNNMLLMRSCALQIKSITKR